MPFRMIITVANTVSRARAEADSPPASISVTISPTSIAVTAAASTSVPNGSPSRCATTSAWCTAASTTPSRPAATTAWYAPPRPSALPASSSQPRTGSTTVHAGSSACAFTGRPGPVRSALRPGAASTNVRLLHACGHGTLGGTSGRDYAASASPCRTIAAGSSPVPCGRRLGRPTAPQGGADASLGRARTEYVAGDRKAAIAEIAGWPELRLRDAVRAASSLAATAAACPSGDCVAAHEIQPVVPPTRDAAALVAPPSGRSLLVLFTDLRTTSAGFNSRSSGACSRSGRPVRPRARRRLRRLPPVVPRRRSSITAPCLSGVMAGRQGFEPRFHGPEPCVLPLDDLPTQPS